ncbi:MAG: hypothetical protein RIQ60_3694 [Pseudomonadota bacterium]
MSAHHTPRLALAAALVVAAAAFALPAQAQSQSGYAGDSALADLVKAELLRLPSFQHPGTDLSVSAHGGQVMVSGWVAYQSDADSARSVALAVPGVSGASTQLHAWSSGYDPSGATVAPSMMLRTAMPATYTGPEDTALESSVKAALLNDPHFSTSETELKVMARTDGRVQVSGWIPYADDELMVRTIARAVPGVTAVRTSLRHWSTEADPS